jgi:hypothetical protein
MLIIVSQLGLLFANAPNVAHVGSFKHASIHQHYAFDGMMDFIYTSLFFLNKEY